MLPTRPSISRIQIFLVVVVFLAASGGSLWMRFSLGQDLSHDFTAFYLAGNMPLASLYDQTAFQALGRRLLAPLGIHYYAPYVRPAVFALPFRLIAWLPYRSAFAVWLAVQYGFYVCAVAIAYRRFQPPLPTLAAFGFFFPAIIGPTAGQDANAMAAIVAISAALVAAGKDSASGAVLACGLYKFNLMILVPFVFLLHGRRRALAAFCVAGLALAVASALLSPPAEYISLLRHIQDLIGLPANALFGLRRLLMDARVPWLYGPCAAVMGILTLVAAKRLPIEEALSVAVIASYFASYRAAWYDAVILTVPLAAALARRTPQTLIPAFFLLLFPGGPALENATAAVVFLLWAALVIPTLRQPP